MKALYNFVPLSDKVLLRQKSNEITHDIPFSDASSGTLRITLTADSPLLVADKATKDDQGVTHKHFVQLNAHTAIPGASIKGVMRAMLEPLTFSRMQRVDAARPGLRDISSSSSAYSTIIGTGTINVQGGWIKREAGQVQFRACKFAKVTHGRLGVFLAHNGTKGITGHELFGRGSLTLIGSTMANNARGQPKWCPISVADKYAIWAKRRNLSWDEAAKINRLGFTSADHKQVAFGANGFSGTLVLTGQISPADQIDGNGKKHDFIFYDDAVPADWETLTDPEWKSFLAVHDTSNSEAAWAHWGPEFDKGKEVPVFWIARQSGFKSIGLAQLPKLAADFSVLDCIQATSPAHARAPGENADFAEALFGFINEIAADKNISALKGRVSFAPLVASKLVAHTHVDAILAAPKPGFTPAYLVQTPLGADGSMRVTHYRQGNIPVYAPYKSYIQANRTEQKPGIRGWKRYPARKEVETPTLDALQRNNKDIWARLYPVAKDSEFVGEIHFHNLRDFELGALIWLLTWGGNNTLLHSLSAGKALGWGQCRIKIDDKASTRVLVKNVTQREFIDSNLCQALRTKFEAIFTDASEVTPALREWKNSDQVKALLSMATARPNNPPMLGQMLMNEAHNEFRDAKKKGEVLPFWPLG